MSSTAASFRHRLQLKQNHLHLQTQNLPPQPQQWPNTSSGCTPASAFPPSTSTTTASRPPLSPRGYSLSAGVGTGSSLRSRFVEGLSMTGSSTNTNTSTSATGRPPLSPRGYSSAAVCTGQSRFVEGSMNDRVSAVPPAGFLGFDEEFDGDKAEVKGEGGVGGGMDCVMEGGGAATKQYRFSEPVSISGMGMDLGRGDVGVEGGVAAGNGGGGTTSSRYQLRRPRSTAGWVSSGRGTAPQQQETKETQPQRGGVVKKTSFLAPLWDGVREKLHLTKSKSSGSIGRVVNSVVGGGGEGERRVERIAAVAEERETSSPVQPVPPPSTVGYPTREEVMESYKNLVASGFFEAHAIRGGRHPLRAGGNGPAPGNKSFADHMAAPGAMPSPTGKSFAEHMAAPASNAPSPSGRSFVDHMAAQQQKPSLPFSSPTRTSMGPPPLPPRGSSQGKPDTMSSPQRGTKRGASIDLAGDAEMVTRKLVKKLRHSASRISMELSGAKDYYSYGTSRPRLSTSSDRPGPLSPTSSVFSGFTSPPSTAAAATADDASSIRHGKLTKPKDGRRRRILGLTRRRRSPEPAPAEEADPDAMMIDEPEPSIAVPEQQSSPTKIHRIITPPPASFRTHYPRAAGLRSSSTTSSVQEHEPLSIVPDPNQGIPIVPRIPRAFCAAMAELAPPPAAASTAAMVVVGAGEGKGEEQKKNEGEEEGKGKAGNRDSGLGGEGDVENLPVWG